MGVQPSNLQEIWPWASNISNIWHLAVIKHTCIIFPADFLRKQKAASTRTGCFWKSVCKSLTFVNFNPNWLYSPDAWLCVSQCCSVTIILAYQWSPRLSCNPTDWKVPEKWRANPFWFFFFESSSSARPLLAGLRSWCSFVKPVRRLAI